MIFLCISRFDIEEQEIKLLEKFFSYEEIKAVKEERDNKLNHIDIELISDTEEQEESIQEDVIQDNEASLLDIDEPELPLPDYST